MKFKTMVDENEYLTEKVKKLEDKLKSLAKKSARKAKNERIRT